MPAKAEEEEDEETPALPDELSEGGADTVDDGTTDKDVPIVQAHLPSSFGLTFCVDKSAKTLRVEARWGQYKREKKEDQIDERTGRPMRVWKRYQRSGIVTLKLDKATVPPTSLNDDFPNVSIKGQVRKRGHGIIITLFLVNGQEEGRPKDEHHLFQPELIVSDPEGGAIFCKRLTRKASAKADPGTKLEEDTMALLYRRHVEFAVGHGVSVSWETTNNTNNTNEIQEEPRAYLIRTRIIPRYEVPRTTAPTATDAAMNPAIDKLASLVLDMKNLAESAPKQVCFQLQPLIDSYRTWIETVERRYFNSCDSCDSWFEAASEAVKCESIRRKALEKGDSRWGQTPFRIGLWVGRRTTPNKTDDAAEAIKQLRGNQFGVGSSGVGSPYQLTACPWCGSAIEPGKHLDSKSFPNESGRTLTYCGDKFGQCHFSRRQAPDEGLPVVVVDEEI